MSVLTILGQLDVGNGQDQDLYAKVIISRAKIVEFFRLRSLLSRMREFSSDFGGLRAFQLLGGFETFDIVRVPDGLPADLCAAFPGGNWVLIRDNQLTSAEPVRFVRSSIFVNLTRFAVWWQVYDDRAVRILFDTVVLSFAEMQQLLSCFPPENQSVADCSPTIEPLVVA